MTPWLSQEIRRVKDLIGQKNTTKAQRKTWLEYLKRLERHAYGCPKAIKANKRRKKK